MAGGICAALAGGLLLAAQAAGAEWTVRGTLKEVRVAARELVIKHEAIPGYMEAMTMPFSVKPEVALEQLQPGDAVQFHLVATEDDGWIDKVTVTQKAATPAATPPALPTAERMPELTLVDEYGAPLPLASLRGQAVVLTFLYTRCPFPAMCPLVASKLQLVQQTLRADPATPTNWRILAVTIDPEHDTPAVLQAYTRQVNADPEKWRFATGTLAEITRLALACGVNFWPEKGLLNHQLRTLVFDTQGKLQATFPENSWVPNQVAEAVREAAAR